AENTAHPVWSPQVPTHPRSKGKPSMYAIVKTGGKQYKVAEGDLVKVEKIEGEAGTAVSLSPILVVDGASVTSESDALSKVTVSCEIVDQTKAPKIRSHKFKNKTGYHKRQGHRQPLTVVKITGIKYSTPGLHAHQFSARGRHP